MRRHEIIKEISRCPGLIISNLGFPSRELYAVADRPGNFYMLGSMGLVSSIGLGLALKRQEKVYVIDGDGSLLMNLGSLVTIAHHAPRNFCLVIVDNQSYGSTGNQPTYTAEKTDLKAICQGAGISAVVCVDTLKQLRELLSKCTDSMSIIIARAVPGNEDVPIIPIAPVEIKERFMAYLKKSSETDGSAG